MSWLWETSAEPAAPLTLEKLVAAQEWARGHYLGEGQPYITVSPAVYEQFARMWGQVLALAEETLAQDVDTPTEPV